MDEARLKELTFALALYNVKGINQADARKLIDRAGSIPAVFSLSRKEIISTIEPKRNVSAAAESLLNYNSFDEDRALIEKSAEKGIGFLLFTDDDFPYSLKFIYDPPVMLFVKGEIRETDALAIGIVGTRKVSNYGRTMSDWLAKELVTRCITVVSGLARGVDSEAHKAALDAGGRTIGVLGCGVDVIYPPENGMLYQRMANSGAVISEFPPGTPPEAWRFPVRNRIIAGLSMGIVVVEAPVKSGALITARVAAEYDREVFAIPGNLTSGNSKGCNKLIREGAKPVTVIEDILEEFNVDFDKETSVFHEGPNLNPSEKKVYEALGSEGSPAEEVILKTSLEASVVSGLLLQLELKGVIRKMSGGFYVPVYKG